MNNNTASTDPMPASSGEGERSSKAHELRDEINKKLAQAKGICWVIHGGEDLAVIGDESIKDSLWAVDELIEQAQSAFKELKAVQS
jgi:hypothetical protein